MTYQDEFFTPEEVDRQIDQVNQLKQGERADAEAIAYLRSFYGTDTQQERETLDRMWNRIAHASPFLQYQPKKEQVIDMQDRQTQSGNQPPRKPRASPLMRRL